VLLFSGVVLFCAVLFGVLFVVLEPGGSEQEEQEAAKQQASASAASVPRRASFDCMMGSLMGGSMR
jgi:predicted secreted protein